MNQDVIHKIVKASGVTAGELILVHYWGEDENKGIANRFMEAVAALGASAVLLQQARTTNRDIFSTAKASGFDEKYFELFSHFDAVLDVFTYQPVVLGFEIEEEQFNLYRRYMAQLFAVLMKSKRFTQIRIPTKENAEESELEAKEYISRMNSAYDVDYEILAQACREKIEKLRKSSQYVLHTGENCSLFFDMEGRNWFVDAGDGDLPCGEVYIAPVETKTQGNVFFQRLFLEEQGWLERVTVFVEDGVVFGSDNACLNQFLQELPKENKVVCEFGIGMNVNVKDLCGYTVLDEKMADTFHIAIGANTMFGGENEASRHMDFVCDGKWSLETGGQIE